MNEAMNEREKNPANLALTKIGLPIQLRTTIHHAPPTHHRPPRTTILPYSTIDHGRRRRRPLPYYHLSKNLPTPRA